MRKISSWLWYLLCGGFSGLLALLASHGYAASAALLSKEPETLGAVRAGYVLGIEFGVCLTLFVICLYGGLKLFFARKRVTP
jgi:hypothetical protein